MQRLELLAFVAVDLNGYSHDVNLDCDGENSAAEVENKSLPVLDEFPTFDGLAIENERVLRQLKQGGFE